MIYCPDSNEIELFKTSDVVENEFIDIENEYVDEDALP